MNRIRVSSSNLASVGYDYDTQTLEIEFKGGSIYRYPNVPESIYAGLMNAGSKGGYFNSHIKNRPFRKVR
ncbi:MAG TPA: KTSC domain-containing protein [Blastocatellia bacterium]|jgi:hypothetical protein